MGNFLECALWTTYLFLPAQIYKSITIFSRGDPASPWISFSSRLLVIYHYYEVARTFITSVFKRKNGEMGEIRKNGEEMSINGEKNSKMVKNVEKW